MNRYIRQFEGQDIEILYDEENQKVLFRLEDVARVAGFAKVSSLRYHTKSKVREVNVDGALYLKARALNKIAKAATKTPGMKRFASWAVGLAGKINIREIKGRPIPPVIDVPLQKPREVAPTKDFGGELYGITQTANSLGMSVKELSDWLVDEGYAGRYTSNKAIYWKPWFKMQGYGTLPMLGGTAAPSKRVIRVPKLTQAGFEYVKSRLASQRTSNVLSFAKKEAETERKAEQTVDELIADTFSEFTQTYRYDAVLGHGRREYRITHPDLIKKVKEVVAQVKLKEIRNE